jgi:hypothetical protein
MVQFLEQEATEETEKSGEAAGLCSLCYLLFELCLEQDTTEKTKIHVVSVLSVASCSIS